MLIFLLDFESMVVGNVHFFRTGNVYVIYGNSETGLSNFVLVLCSMHPADGLLKKPVLVIYLFNKTGSFPINIRNVSKMAKKLAVLTSKTN